MQFRVFYRFDKLLYCLWWF